MLSPRDSTDLQSLKVQALELLEWTMDDLSPPGHKLQIKCGIEREGHIVPPDLSNLTKEKNLPEFSFLHDVRVVMENYIQQLHDEFRVRFPDLEKLLEEKTHYNKSGLYHDTNGLFLLELVTKPLGLSEAAKADVELSDALKHLLAEKDIGLVFGKTPTGLRSYLKQHHGWKDAAIAEFLKGEIYPREVPGSPPQDVLVGRGQQGNVSIWFDDKNNLFSAHGRASSLMYVCGAVITHMLKDMVMPCRNGNYDRIVSNEDYSVQNIGVGGKKKDRAAVHTVIPSNLRGYDTDKIRIELRMPASEADPYDVALAAGAPLVKTLLDCCQKDENGKILLKDGRPVTAPGAPVAAMHPMPKSHEEAKKIFNSKDNSYFKLLNELADRKIVKLEERFDQTGNMADQQLLRQAQDLKDLGSRMHALYCRAEGMQSAMPQPRHRPEMAISY